MLKLLRTAGIGPDALTANLLLCLEELDFSSDCYSDSNSVQNYLATMSISFRGVKNQWVNDIVHVWDLYVLLVLMVSSGDAIGVF